MPHIASPGASCSKLTASVKISNVNITNTLLFFLLEKCENIFKICNAKILTFFQQKITAYLIM